MPRRQIIGVVGGVFLESGHVHQLEGWVRNDHREAVAFGDGTDQ